MPAWAMTGYDSQLTSVLFSLNFGRAFRLNSAVVSSCLDLHLVVSFDSRQF